MIADPDSSIFTPHRLSLREGALTLGRLIQLAERTRSPRSP